MTILVLKIKFLTKLIQHKIRACLAALSNPDNFSILTNMSELIYAGLLTIKLILAQDFSVSADNKCRSTSLVCTMYPAWR